MTATRPLRPSGTARSRSLELGGQAVHLFRFAAPVDLAYSYFCDVPAVFQLLPDALEVYAYGPERYRLLVGATDGHGHAMVAVFDLRTEHDPYRCIRVLPADDGPPVEVRGMAFHGALAAEAIFHQHPEGTMVEYSVDIAMDIPIPNVLRLMPQSMLQTIGERAMEYKMTQMITGFTRSVAADFATWAHEVREA